MDDTDPESALVQQFRALAGAAAHATTFALEVHGQRFAVEYSGGSSSSLTLRAPYAPRGDRVAPASSERGGAAGGYRAPAHANVRAIRPMRIEMRPERDADRDAKESGVAREAQTGDEAFDRVVYIDSPSDESVIRHVLAAPELRAGVTALLGEGFSHVTIDNHQEQIVATLSQFASAARRPDRAARIADAFAAVAANVPHVERSDATHAPDNLGCVLGLASVLVVLGGAAAIPLYMWASPAGCTVSDGDGTSLVCTQSRCCTPLPLGLALGLLLGIVLALTLPRLIRGRSNSHRRATWAAIVLVAAAIELSIAVASAAYWL